jgi:multiple sugar transport system substrate-binding protein
MDQKKEKRMKPRKYLYFVLIVILLLSACGGPAATPKPANTTHPEPPPKTDVVTLEFWNGFNAHEVEALNQMIEKYWTPTHPNIKINARGEMGPDQIMTAISGGEQVDVAILWDPYNVKIWAKQGALIEMTPFIMKQNAKMEDIFVPAGLQWVKEEDGRYYGLPFVNFNQGFYWNKDLFRKAGLDPEKPPKTIAELEEYAKKLTIVDNNGEITQLGWSPRGSEIALGLNFGAKYYEPKTGNITATDPNLEEALNWELNLEKGFGLDKVNKFVAGFAGAGNDPFMLGKLAMTIGGCWNVTFIEKNGVQIDYGVGPIPYKDAAYAGANDVETNPIIIPKTTKYPNEAWEFAWFLSSNPDVSREFANLVSNLPQVKEAMKNFSSEPKTMVFVDLSNSPNATGWAPIAVVATYATELGTAFENIYNEKATVEEALATVQKNVQAEADKLK